MRSEVAGAVARARAKQARTIRRVMNTPQEGIEDKEYPVFPGTRQRNRRRGWGSWS